MYLLLLICAILVVCKISSHLRTRIHNKREALRRGCLPPADAPNLGFFGLNTLRASIAATRAGHGPQWMHKMLNDIGKDVHTVSANILDYQLLITGDLENVKVIFNTQASNFDIGPHRERTFKSVFEIGIMTARGQRWKHSRALIRPQFARTNVADPEMLEKHFQCLLKRLEVNTSGWTDIMDLQPLFQIFTLDTGTEFLYGQSVFSQDSELRARRPLSWEKGKHVPDIGRALWQNTADSFAQGHFSNTNKFVLLTELAKTTKDPLELRSETLNVLHASRDTTAALIGWVVYLLAGHKVVFRKLRDEVLKSFPLRATDENKITLESLQSLRYMHNVINETIRLIGIIPMNERAATCDTTLPRGGGHDGQSPIFVAKGQQLLTPTYSMQHREDIWGIDHGDFRPERWENRRHSWDWIPFGSDVRQCLGQQYAKTETMYVVVQLLRDFDCIEPSDTESEEILFHHTIEDRSGTGVRVRMHANSSRIPRVGGLDIEMCVDRGGLIV